MPRMKVSSEWMKGIISPDPHRPKAKDPMPDLSNGLLMDLMTVLNIPAVRKFNKPKTEEEENKLREKGDSIKLEGK